MNVGRKRKRKGVGTGGQLKIRESREHNGLCRRE